MAVNKIDPKVIFASEAPTQDTPAVFTNKTVGWGESRKNGGRPTIKQMNALQQENDLKILWLNENSVLPYDASIDYPINAVTIKDGTFKIFNGTAWNLFLTKASIGLNNVDNTSDANKPISTATQTALNLKADKTYVDNKTHASLTDRDAVNAHPSTSIVDASGETQQQVNYNGGSTWHSRVGGYQENERVVLTNGDIVKSTVDGNVNNPNTDMTGWVNSSLASQIFYDNGMSVQALSNLTVTPFNFGAKGDGVTDDTQAIQDCVIFAIANKVSIMSPTAKFAYSSTILIPQLFDTTFTRNFIVSLNFGNSEFIALSDVTLFETGYYSGGNLVSSFGTPDMAHNSFGISLGGFTISSNVGYLSSEALRIQDWHQQSSIKDISSSVCQTILHSHNSFYCNFEYINGSYSDEKAGNRFIFSGSHNLNTFRKLIAVNSVIGYKFDGPVTAATFSEVSLEGMTIGAQFNASVYDFNVVGDYCENVTDVCFQFKDYSLLVNFGSGYVNFIDSPTMNFVEYAPLPGNGILIDSARAFQNMQPSNKIIKNTEDVYGFGIEINRAAIQGSTLADTLPDTTYGAHVYLNQISKFAGYTAKVANQYVVGNYSGQFTSGYANQNGFSWNNLGNSTLSLSTKMKDSKTQRVYVSIDCVIGGVDTLIQGEFIGGFPAKFYEFTPTGVSVTSRLEMTTVDGFLHIGGVLSGVIQSVSGEIRLV